LKTPAWGPAFSKGSTSWELDAHGVRPAIRIFKADIVMTTTASSTINAFADFILAELRVPSVRARLVAAGAESIAVALSGNIINIDDAIAWMGETCFDLVGASSTSRTIAYAKAAAGVTHGRQS
jgi:hypothetical protein